MSTKVQSLFVSEITLNDSYRMVNKNNHNEFVFKAMIRNNKRSYFTLYFSTKYSAKDIAEYMWDSFFKAYPRAKEAFDNGTSSLYLTFDN